MSVIAKEAMPEQPNSASIISVIEKAVLNPDIDVNKMQQLLDMQERVFNKQAEMKFNESMTAVQSEIGTIDRNKTNDQTKSKYSDLNQINAQITPIYTKHGFALSFGTDDCPLENHIRITCEVSHTGGFTKRYKYDSALDGEGMQGKRNKTSVQAAGSSSSYGRRYLIMLIFNIATSDDNDGNGAVQLINDDQLTQLNKSISEVGGDIEEKILKWARIEHLHKLPASRFSNAMKVVEARRK